MAKYTLTTEQILDILAATPNRIAELTAPLDPTLFHTAPANDAWSVNDVLSHLRGCADVWGDCIEKILTHDHPTIRAIDPVTWMKKTDYQQQDFHESLAAFTKQRHELLARLRPLQPADWKRAATVTNTGIPRTNSVETYGIRLALHERQHYRQFAKIVTALQTRSDYKI